MALPNDSKHTLLSLNDPMNNIFVKRHPTDYFNYWSHHEKMVAIDNKILFMGGLDLCFGRYEYKDYLLKEP